MSEELILDYAWARPDPAAIKAAGYSGVARYLSNDPSKNLTATERDSLLSAGLSICLVWETTATRASEGFQAGVQDALAAEGQAKALGLPEAVSIFYAVDQGTTHDAVLPYFQGLLSVAVHTVGVYGDLDVVDGLLANGGVRVGWQTCAWSGQTVSQKAHLYQRVKPTVANPIANADENVVLQPFPMWGNDVHPPVVASPLPPVFTNPSPAAPSIGLNVQIIDLRPAGLFHSVTGPGVKPMQRLLNVTADGAAGFLTRRALGDAQARAGLPVDYIFGPKTAEALLAGK